MTLNKEKGLKVPKISRICIFLDSNFLYPWVLNFRKNKVVKFLSHNRFPYSKSHMWKVNEVWVDFEQFPLV